MLASVTLCKVLLASVSVYLSGKVSPAGRADPVPPYGMLVAQARVEARRDQHQVWHEVPEQKIFNKHYCTVYKRPCT